MVEIKSYECFKQKFNNSDDFMTRDIKLGALSAKLAYIDCLIDASIIQEGVINSLSKIKKLPQKNILDHLLKNTLISINPTIKNEFGELEHDLLSGNCLIFLENELNVISIPAQGFSKRAISEPPTAAVLKGPREGFIEDLNTNISMLRRKLKTHEFVIKKLQIGERSKTDICVAYISSIADDCVVAEVMRRLSAIDIDGVLDSFYLQELLQEKNNNIFKQVGNSEKPDIIVSKLLEGRVAVLVDGSPIVLTVPFLLIEDLQSADDYYSHSGRATFLRIIRIFGMIIGVLLPGVYVATQIFHYRLLPINLLISLLDSVQNLAFPPLIEILFVLFIFEILNEASVRMPKHMGMAVSIIGALVLGDTAVQAGLISPPAILVVAISGITIYTIPDEMGTLPLIRLIFTIIGGISGYYGLLIGSIFLVCYVAGLQSYGTPYLAPYAPNIKLDKKDALTKNSLKSQITRPTSIPNKNRIRIRNSDSQEEGVGQ